MVEIGSEVNAKKIWNHVNKCGFNAFSQKNGWKKVLDAIELPTNGNGEPKLPSDYDKKNLIYTHYEKRRSYYKKREYPFKEHIVNFGEDFKE